MLKQPGMMIPKDFVGIRHLAFFVAPYPVACPSESPRTVLDPTAPLPIAPPPTLPAVPNVDAGAALALVSDTWLAHELLAFAIDEGVTEPAWRSMIAAHFRQGGTVTALEDLLALAWNLGLDVGRTSEVLASRAYRRGPGSSRHLHSNCGRACDRTLGSKQSPTRERN